MTYKEKREHKFKILFQYYFQKGNIDSIIDNYFDNCPYNEGDVFFIEKENNVHENIAKTNDDLDVKNESDKAISANDDDDIYDIRFKIKDLINKSEEIDTILKDNLSTWDIGRVGKTELAIIRLAIYEMYYDVSIDLPVAINEAVELAKMYGDEKAQRFVNGVLATIYRAKKGN